MATFADVREAAAAADAAADAAYAAYAAYAAAYAAADAAYADANQVIMARLVRRRIPYSCVAQALRKYRKVNP